MRPLALLFLSLPLFAQTPVTNNVWTDNGDTISTQKNLSIGTTLLGAGQGINILAKGAKCDGATDDTAALQAAIQQAFVNGGGLIYIPGGQTCRINGQIVIPKDAATPWAMPPIRITGAVNSTSMSDVEAPIRGGSTLDLRYAGAVSNNDEGAKIVTYGAGLLEIDHLVLKDGGSDCNPFLYGTLTVLKIHDNTFLGTGYRTTSCNDALILGGITPWNVALTGGGTDRFQGYGTVIRDNTFGQIRRAVYARSAVNAIKIVDNDVLNTSGSNLAGGAAFEFLGNVGYGTSTNEVNGNLVEMYGYGCGVKLTLSHYNTFIGNMFWDTPVGGTYAFCGPDSGTTIGNIIIGRGMVGAAADYTFNPTWSHSGAYELISDTPSTVPKCTRYSYNFADAAFKVASTITTITLGGMLADEVVTGIRIKHGGAFAGPGVTSATVSLGDGTTADVYAPAFDVFQSTGTAAGKFWMSGFGFQSANAAAHNLVATFIANTNWGNGSATVLTAGNVQFHVCTMRLF